MNERIKELARHAGFPVIDGELFSGVREECPITPDLEEFAESIVRECLEQIDKIRDGCEADNEDQQALGADWAGLAVSRYFGVKE